MTTFAYSAAWQPAAEKWSKSAVGNGAPLWTSLVVLLIGLVGCGIGWALAGSQHYRMMTYRPVPARIVASKIQRHYSHSRYGKGYTYEPIISYSYTVGQRQYQSATLLPSGSLATSHDWASAIISRYPSGAQVNAWFNPKSPDESFLMREVRWEPYAFCVFPTLIALIAVCMILTRVPRRIRPPIPQDGQWYRILQDRTLATRFLRVLLVSIAWLAYIGIVIGDYFVLNSRRINMPLAWFILYAVVVTFFVVYPVWENFRLRRDFRDAQVCVSRWPLHHGDAMRVRIRQSIAQPIQVEKVSVGLVCTCDEYARHGTKNQYTSNITWSDGKELDVHQTFSGIGQFEAQCDLSLPPDAATSSVSNGYPFYRWHIALAITARDQPRLEVHFPIVIGTPQQV